MIVTGHQPNFLPGVSVMAKIAAADAVIWMDEMAYERHGFVNRNRFDGESWMTIPVAEADTFVPINRVRIADPHGRAREKVARTLEYRGFLDMARELRRPYGLLVGLNVALLRRIIVRMEYYSVLRPMISPKLGQFFQSHLAAGRYDDVSEGLAAMTAELGGTVWLSGPSGRNYLDERPFVARGIEVDYFEHNGPNPCALELLTGGRLKEAA